MQNQMDSFLNNNPEILSKFKYIKEQELYKFYHNTELILPSVYEGLPNVICESMIIGCPVLASSISDNPLILVVEEGYCSTLILLNLFVM